MPKEYETGANNIIKTVYRFLAARAKDGVLPPFFWFRRTAALEKTTFITFSHTLEVWLYENCFMT